MHLWGDIPAIRNLLSVTDKKPATIRSISRATGILFCLSNGINTVTDISRHCRLSTSTVRRLLKATQKFGNTIYEGGESWLHEYQPQ